jgi:hypothetical protein
MLTNLHAIRLLAGRPAGGGGACSSRLLFLRSVWPVDGETTTHYRKKKAEEKLDARACIFTFLGIDRSQGIKCRGGATKGNVFLRRSSTSSRAGPDDTNRKGRRPALKV